MSGRTSRRSQRASFRDKAPAKPLLTKKQKIVAGIALLLILTAVIGYRPLRYSMLVGSVAKGDKAAVDTLFNDKGWRGSAVGVCARYLKPAESPEEEAKRTAETPKAAAYGLGLAIRSGDLRASGLAKAIEIIEGGPDESRRPLAEELIKCAEQSRENQDPGLMASLVPLFLKCVDGTDQDIRLSGIKGLGTYQAPNGGCLRLLRVAREEKGAPRAAALNGIEMSATPEAVGELLTSMSQQEDQPLAAAALKGFTKVRDEAKTPALLKQLSNPSSQVRLEIVRALSLRKSDDSAAGGIVRALSDGSPDVRCAAVTAFPTMRIKASEATKLAPLVTDEDEKVRLATGKTLGKLTDETSWKVLFGAFQKQMDGKTLEAFLKSVGIRGYTKNKDGRRSLVVTRMVVDLFDKHSESSEVISKTLAELTALSRYPHRMVERPKWSASAWKEWQKNAEEREVLIAEAVKKLETAQKKQSIEYRDEFGRLLEETDAALALLEKAKGMCREDGEDEAYCEDLEAFYSKMRYNFQKHKALDFGPR